MLFTIDLQQLHQRKVNKSNIQHPILSTLRNIQQKEFTGFNETYLVHKCFNRMGFTPE